MPFKIGKYMECQLTSTLFPSAAQQALQRAAALVEASASNYGLPANGSFPRAAFQLDTQWNTSNGPSPTGETDQHAMADPRITPMQHSELGNHEALSHATTTTTTPGVGARSARASLSLPNGRSGGPHRYNTSVAPPLARDMASPPGDIMEWRHKLFDVLHNPVTMPKDQWDELWVWIDNLWTPRRVPYTKKDGTVHYEWRCRYHKKQPLPSKSTGRRKREIRKGYGCPARMTANLNPHAHVIQVEGTDTHNHSLEELDTTKISSGVRKWTSMHVQMGMQPKEIEALISNKDGAGPQATTTTTTTTSSAREALDTAGGKLLDEKTIRNIARRWRWPAHKFNMRQDDLFRDLHSRHNTLPFAIQDAAAFHRDVCDVSETARTADELHTLLDELKEERVRQLDARFDAAGTLLTRDPTRVGEQHWENVLQMFRDRSYDALVRYFTAYVGEDEVDASQPTATAAAAATGAAAMSSMPDT